VSFAVMLTDQEKHAKKNLSNVYTFSFGD
jgi:hypothetical protein